MTESNNEKPVRMVTRKELVDLGCSQVLIDHAFKNGRGSVDIEVLAKQYARIDGKPVHGLDVLLKRLDPPYEGVVAKPSLSSFELMSLLLCGPNYQPPNRGPGSRSKA